MSLPRRLFPAIAAAAAIGAACSDPVSRPPATFTNVIDTVVLSALTGTPLTEPSGFDVVLGVPVRTDRNSSFDFAFDIDIGGAARLHPARTLGLGTDAGLLRSDESFDAIASAPLEGYVGDTAFVVSEGAVLVARSRAAQCPLIASSLPRYGKFRVLALDQPARRITLELLVDLNCGYRGLEPGTPEN